MPTINGTVNADTLTAGDNQDYLIQGLAAADVLTGLGGDDTIYGFQSTGSDTADGGDTINGGAAPVS